MASKIDILNKQLRDRIRAGQPNIWTHGGGLCFSLAKNGKASWVFRYSFGGRRRVMTLQPYDAAITDRDFKSLELVALEHAEQIAQGIDPLDMRNNAKTIAKTGETFRETAEAYIETQRPSWKNPKHADQWVNTLEQFVYPLVGNMKPHEIGITDVLRVLQQPHKRRGNKKSVPLWEAVPETASRVRMRIEKVISAAKSKGVGSADKDIRARWTGHHNPARWEDGLEHWLGVKKKTDAHFAAIAYSEVGAIVSELRGKNDFSSRALLLTILTGVRTNEALNAVWSEFDLEAAIWEIPAERMKAGRIHRVPLSTLAVEMLRKQPRYVGNKYVFPGARRGKPLSNMAMLEVLRGIKGHGATVHGFRSSLRDWITDTTVHPNEIAEMVLAHTVGNKTEAAYRRGEALQRRSILMQQWCDYLVMDGNKYNEEWGKYIAVDDVFDKKAA